MGERLRLSAGPITLELEPGLGGSVTRFDYDGRPVFRPAPDDAADVLQTSAFPLTPFCNRVRDGRFAFAGREVLLQPNLPPQRHPLHGQGWRSAWTVVQADAGSATLRVRHDAGDWPWTYEAEQRFTVADSTLAWTLSTTNRDTAPMPCGLGWHPYWPANAETVLDAEVTTVWLIDAEIMPTEAAPAEGRYALRDRRISGADLDNGYEGWSGVARLTWPDTGLRAEMRAPGAARFQVYAPAEGGLVCAEPVTNRNGVFGYPPEQWPELGVAILAPGDTAELAVELRVARL